MAIFWPCKHNKEPFTTVPTYDEMKQFAGREATLSQCGIYSWSLDCFSFVFHEYKFSVQIWLVFNYKRIPFCSRRRGNVTQT